MAAAFSSNMNLSGRIADEFAKILCEEGITLI
jgi:hypothetical protein